MSARAPAEPPAPPAPQPVRELAQWTVLRDAACARGEPALLQCGSARCARCPAFAAAVRELGEELRFAWAYADLHDAEEDLLECLQVSQLPAFVLVSAGGAEGAEGGEAGEAGEQRVVQQQAASPEQVRAALRAACQPRLRLDADF